MLIKRIAIKKRWDTPIFILVHLFPIFTWWWRRPHRKGIWRNLRAQCSPVKLPVSQKDLNRGRWDTPIFMRGWFHTSAQWRRRPHRKRSWRNIICRPVKLRVNQTHCNQRETDTPILILEDVFHTLRERFIPVKSGERCLRSAQVLGNNSILWGPFPQILLN
jgi:hypothetical protein